MNQFGRRIGLLICVSSLLSLPSQAQQKKNNAADISVPGQLSTIHLVSPEPDGQWTIPAGDYANTRYSPLDQINAENVKNLKLVGIMEMGIPHGAEGQPLVVNNTMYVVTPFPNDLIALDLTKPNFPMKWKYEPRPDPKAEGVACCDVVNRGASYADGKIVYATLDNNVVAVDANTGKQLWRTQVGDIKIGMTTTMAPVVVKNVVMVGSSGGELGVRGRVIGLDLQTGNVKWTA